MGEASESADGRSTDRPIDPGDEQLTAVVTPASAPSFEAPLVAAGEKFSRFVVLEEVGRGGMGRVLRAYDPKLQREVALKEVTHAGLGHDAARRLAAEARAMAKISHPNVVAVYDVADDGQGELVLVMEYVPGRTLRHWLREAEHPWSEVVQRLVLAGRGLAAAHAAELLHRDFKPANVLVGDDGSIKVTDFGLAKAAGDRSDPAASLAASNESGDDLTEAGIVLGTPRYMAPEQHRGEALSPAVDQYAFCVTLWEGICGAPPFSGPRSAADKLEGPPPWPASTVPRAIGEAIRRGLAPRPADRWPSMNALLEALTWDPSRRRRRGLAVFVGVAGVAIAGTGWHSWANARAQRCSGAQAQLAEVWNEERRDAVEAAFLATGGPYAERLWQSTASQLDGYANDWVAMHVDACEATTIRGEQSTTVMDLRMACLHEAKDGLGAAVDLLAEADATVVSRSHRVIAGLRPMTRCADIDALSAEVEPPEPRDAAAVDDARRLLLEASAAEHAGRYELARARVESAEARVAGVEYAPVHAELRVRKGAVLELFGDYGAAEAELRQALGIAASARHWDAMGRAARHLVFVVGVRLRRPDEIAVYRDLALGLAKDDPAFEAGLRSNVAVVLSRDGKHEEAEAEHRRALALRIDLLGPEHPDVATSRSNLANTLDALGRFDEAEAENREVLALREKVLGPEHPDVALSRSNLGDVLRSQGRYDEAAAEHRAALELRARSLGPDHPEVAASHNNLGNVLAQSGKLEEAEREHRRALELRIGTLGADHADVAMSHNNIGNVLHARGEDESAATEFRAALQIFERALGPAHQSVAIARGNLANALGGMGRYTAAEEEYRRALEQLEASLGPGHPEVALVRSNLGVTLASQGRHALAEAEHRRVLELRIAALGPEHVHVGFTHHNLANALRDQGRLTDAETEYRKAMAILETTLDPEHPDRVALEKDLADLRR